MSKNYVEIEGVHHVAYRCRDAEQTRWFYEDVLGLKLAAAMSFDHISGTDKEMKYMHILVNMVQLYLNYKVKRKHQNMPKF